jgi:hypothetical protein
MRYFLFAAFAGKARAFHESSGVVSSDKASYSGTQCSCLPAFEKSNAIAQVRASLMQAYSTAATAAASAAALCAA